MPDQDILNQLLSTTCLCGKAKQTKNSFCLDCYRALPTEKQRALYRRFGNGYEEAFEDATEFLTEAGED